MMMTMMMTTAMTMTTMLWILFKHVNSTVKYVFVPSLFPLCRKNACSQQSTFGDIGNRDRRVFMFSGGGGSRSLQTAWGSDVLVASCWFFFVGVMALEVYIHATSILFAWEFFFANVFRGKLK